MKSCYMKLLLITVLLLYLITPANGNQMNTNQFKMDNVMQMTKEELGIALIPDKILATSTENILQSVFLKIATPTQPAKACMLECTPDMTKIDSMTRTNDVCWIPNLIPPKPSILEKISLSSPNECLARCLLNSLCGLLTFSSDTGICLLQTPHMYNLNAVDMERNSVSALLVCLLEEHHTSREALCRNENPLFNGVVQAMDVALETQVNLHLQRFQDIKSSYSLNVTKLQISANERKRRGLSWEDFDPLEEVPVVGYFYQLLKSPSENKKIKSHLMGLQDRFQSFVQKSMEMHQNTRKFDLQILEIVENQLGRVYEEINGIKCDIASLASLLVYQQSLLIHYTKLNRMFFSTAHGKLSSTIAETLTLNDLETIVLNNPNFRQTLFQTNPEVLYRVSELLLLQVQPHANALLFHFLLVAPKLTKTSLHQTFNTIKVPIASDVDSSLCFVVDTPESIILKEGKFFAVDITDCTTKNDVIYCHQQFEDRFSPNVKEIPCLNNEIGHCALTPVSSCDTKMTYTKAGALVFSKSQILAMPRTETTNLEVIGDSNKFTYFLKWQQYTMIQCGRDIMYSLDNSQTATNLTIEATNIRLDISSHLQTQETKLRSENITLLRHQIENTTKIALKDYEANYLGLGASKKQLFEWASYLSIVGTIISVLAFSCLCCFKRLKKNNRMLRTVLETTRQERERRRMQKYNLSYTTLPTRTPENVPTAVCTEIVELETAPQPPKVHTPPSPRKKTRNKSCQVSSTSSSSSPETPPRQRTQPTRSRPKSKSRKTIGPFDSN